MQTLVDDKDLTWLTKWQWSARKSYNVWYVIRYMPREYRSYAVVFMHREILEANTGVLVDHKNGDGLDNRRANLRLANTQENCANQRKVVSYGGKKPSSIYKGVSWSKQHERWGARIMVNRRQVFLGLYSTEFSAAIAYNAAALEHFGEYARLNLVEEVSA